MKDESQFSLSLLAEQERLRSQRLAGVRTILVVLSSQGMAFDVDGLRGLIHGAYPDAAVFFVTTSGKNLGTRVKGHVDLVIDFTGPRQRQGWFFARRLRRMARFAVGRNAGRTKLMAHISPNKTVEGFIGGAFGSAGASPPTKL